MIRIHKKLIYRTLLTILFVISGLMVAAISLPSLVCDQFKINGTSMSPTLQTGDHIIVNKLLMGGRIYTNMTFPTRTWSVSVCPGSGISGLETWPCSIIHSAEGITKSNSR